MMNQEKGSDQLMLNQFCNLMTWYILEQTRFASQRQGSASKQTQWTISMDLRNSYQYSNLQSQNWNDSCEEVEKNIINSNKNLVKQKW